MSKLVIILLLVFSTHIAIGAEILKVNWETKHGAPPAKLSNKNKELLPLIRLGVSLVPESTVMQMTFLGSTALGLSEDKALALQTELSARYKVIAEDSIFSAAPSALAYCYSAEKPNRGFATVYVPDNIGKNTSAIVFLHGYGGSFSFYLHYFATEFPDHIIICPAYGISSALIPSDYIQECIQITSQKLDVPIEKPVLVGLSAGGFGGFREYARRPFSYAGYICMAAYPPKDIIAKVPRTGRIRLLAGGNETFVASGALGRAEHKLQQRVGDYISHLIPEEEHFFMLTSEKATKEKIRAWVTRLETKSVK